MELYSKLKGDLDGTSNAKIEIHMKNQNGKMEWINMGQEGPKTCLLTCMVECTCILTIILTSIKEN